MKGTPTRPLHLLSDCTIDDLRALMTSFRESEHFDAFEMGMTCATVLFIDMLRRGGTISEAEVLGRSYPLAAVLGGLYLAGRLGIPDPVTAAIAALPQERAD